MFLVYSRDDALLSTDEKDASRLINSNKYILFAVQRAKGKRRCDLGCSVSPFSSLYYCGAHAYNMRWERDRQDSPWPVERTETLEGRTGQSRVQRL
jgi:hypothetical protein